MPPELEAEIEFVDEGIQDVDEGIQDVDPNRPADLVGMTVITGTALRAYELAARFRARIRTRRPGRNAFPAIRSRD